MTEFKSKRLALGYSVREIAPLLGTSPRTIENWDQGIRTPPGAVNVLMKTLKKKGEVKQ